MIPLNTVRSLEALRMFETVARMGSFSQAASELGVTHGAVSRQIATLEHDLGFPLFTRSSRGVKLTRAGKNMFAATHKAMSDISRAIDRLKLGVEQQPFFVSCERSIAVKWLIPRLRAFQDRNPGLIVYLSTGGGAVDFSASPVDVAIRRADFPFDPSWRAVQFMKEYIGPVMKPDLVERFEQGRLARLHTTTRPSAWETWASLSDTMLPDVPDQFFDHFFLCLEAALSGLGAAVVPYAIAVDAVSSGQLAAPKGFTPDGTDYCLISEDAFESDQRKPKFLAWLRSEAAIPQVQKRVADPSL